MKGKDKDAILLRVVYPLKQIGSVRVSKKDKISKVLRDVQVRHAKVFSKEELALMRVSLAGQLLPADNRIEAHYPTASGENHLTVVKGLPESDIPVCPVHTLPFIFYSKKHNYMLCRECVYRTDHAGVTHPDAEQYVVSPGDLTEKQRRAAFKDAQGISDRIGEEKALDELSHLIDTLNNGGLKPARKSSEEFEKERKNFTKERQIEMERDAGNLAGRSPGVHEDVVTFIKRVISAGELDPMTLSFGEEELNQRNHLGRTPLMVAVTEGRMDVLEVLLKNGANPNLLSTYSSDKHRVLSSIASGAGARFDCSKKGVDNHCFAGDITGGGITPLVAAAAEGNVVAVSNLVENGADVNFREPSSGMTALCASVASQLDVSVDIAKILLDSGGSVNAQLNDGSTALDVAILFDHPKFFDKILDMAGVLPTDAFPEGVPAGAFFLVADKDDRLALSPSRSFSGGFTSLLVAAQLGRPYMAKRLLSVGSDVLCRDKLGSTVLMHASAWTDVLPVVLSHGLPNTKEGVLPPFPFPLVHALETSRQYVFAPVSFSEGQRDSWLGKGGDLGSTLSCTRTPTDVFAGVNEKTPGGTALNATRYDALMVSIQAGHLEHVKYFLELHITFWGERKQQNLATELRHTEYPYVSLTHTLRTAMLAALYFCTPLVAEHLLGALQKHLNQSIAEVMHFSREELCCICTTGDTLFDVAMHRHDRESCPKTAPTLAFLFKHDLIDIEGTCNPTPDGPHKIPDNVIRSHNSAPHFYFTGKHGVDLRSQNIDAQERMGAPIMAIIGNGHNIGTILDEDVKKIEFGTDPMEKPGRNFMPRLVIAAVEAVRLKSNPTEDEDAEYLLNMTNHIMVQAANKAEIEPFDATHGIVKEFYKQGGKSRYTYLEVMQMALCCTVELHSSVQERRCPLRGSPFPPNPIRLLKAVVIIDKCLAIQGITAPHRLIPSALSLATALRCPELVQKLLAAGFNPYGMDAYGRSPMTYAADLTCATPFLRESVAAVSEKFQHQVGERPPGVEGKVYGPVSDLNIKQLLFEHDWRGENAIFRSLVLDEANLTEFILKEAGGGGDIFARNAQNDFALQARIQTHSILHRRCALSEDPRVFKQINLIRTSLNVRVTSSFLVLRSKKQLAIQRGVDEMRKTLFEKDSFGRSLLEYAVEDGNEDSFIRITNFFSVSGDGKPENEPARRLAVLNGLLQCMHATRWHHGRAYKVTAIATKLITSIVGELPEGILTEDVLKGEERKIFIRALSASMGGDSDVLMKAMNNAVATNDDYVLTQIIKHDAAKLLAEVAKTQPNLRKKVISVAPNEDKGYYLAHWCVEYSAKRCAEQCSKFDKWKEFINARDKSGATPLHLAAERGYFPMVKTLVDLNPDMQTTRDRDGTTPAAIACLAKHIDCVQYILHGRPKASYPSHTTKSQTTVFEMALTMGLEDVALSIATYKTQSD